MLLPKYVMRHSTTCSVCYHAGETGVKLFETQWFSSTTHALLANNYASLAREQDFDEEERYSASDVEAPSAVTQHMQISGWPRHGGTMSEEFLSGFTTGWNLFCG
eukprot:6487158-Amphidinium_carterae.1